MTEQTQPVGDAEPRAYWLSPEYREKYSDEDREQGAKEGWAMPDGSYPIKDAEDLDNAIQAVGRGGADHDTIRKHIISRAHALNLAGRVPDNWNADGSLKQSNSSRSSRSSRRSKDRHRATPLGREVRFFSPQQVELRSTIGGDSPEIRIEGAAIMYGVPYSVVDRFGEFRETIHAGAASALIARNVDCRLLLNHEGLPMARTLSGTMTLIDGDDALRFRATLDARQQLANDFAIAIERGDLSQMSIGMMVDDDDWGMDGEMETRDIYGLADLIDVSGVTYPCSPTTHIEVALRMASMMPIESDARLRQLEVVLRSGKPLSKANLQHVLAIIHAAHSLAAAGGIDPGTLGLGADKDAGTTHEDGSEGGTGVESGEGPGIVFTDGSGARSDDNLDAETRDQAENDENLADAETGGPAITASTLRFLNEAGR